MSDYYRLAKGAVITTICTAAFIASVIKARGCDCNYDNTLPSPDAEVIYYWQDNPNPDRNYLPPRPERGPENAAISYSDKSLHLEPYTHRTQ